MSTRDNVGGMTNEYCTGCGACASICPINAIQMVSDNEGFLCPWVNEELCIHCGKCYSICPSINPISVVKDKPMYAVMASDEIRAFSSSGGVFYLLAEEVINQNGVVFGAIYSDDFLSVKHDIAQNMEEVKKMCGSKYTQSIIGDTFIQAREKLEHGRRVLFCGTPCQIAGLKKYLGCEYENLLMVDFLCLGVCSPKSYTSYVSEISRGKKVKYLSFRDKVRGGWNASLTIELEDGETVHESLSDSLYLEGMQKGCQNRLCCGDCKYIGQTSAADITLGDFWGVGLVNSKWDDFKGTSLIQVSTDQGNRSIQSLKEKSILFEEVELQAVKKYNSRLEHAFTPSVQRNVYFSELNQCGSHKALKRALTEFDIGIYGWWFGTNYGGSLSYYALYNVIKEMGYSVVMMDGPYARGNWREWAFDHPVRRFIEEHYNVCDDRSYRTICEQGVHFHTALVGSDQMWNYKYMKDNSQNPYEEMYYLLDSVDDSCVKIAYATSLGSEMHFFSEEAKRKASFNMERFDAISVREDESIPLLKERMHIDVQRNLDPVFLCDIGLYYELEKKSTLDIDAPFLLAYILDPTVEKKEEIQRFAESKGLIPYFITERLFWDIKQIDSVYGDTCLLLDIDKTEDFLYLFHNCNFIITDSYHGLCFSIIFHKEFICLCNEGRGKERFQTLLNITNLSPRMITNIDGLLKNSSSLEMINYEKVDKELKEIRNNSLLWLKEKLCLNLNKKVSVYDVLREDNRKIHDIIETNLNSGEQTQSLISNVQFELDCHWNSLQMHQDSLRVLQSMIENKANNLESVVNQNRIENMHKDDIFETRISSIEDSIRTQDETIRQLTENVSLVLTKLENGFSEVNEKNRELSNSISIQQDQINSIHKIGFIRVILYLKRRLVKLKQMIIKKRGN